ncbi:hypothetical protein HZB60_10630 [candidate division KSB1 bacterium]|nr:hypothetical protein [candidate division KSB1 bacterium]
MKRISRVLNIGLVLCLTAVPLSAVAQPQQSENFRITKSVLDAGGGASSSANFQLHSAFGQPTPIGVQTSENFILYAGYLTPTLAPGVLNPIDDLVVARVVGPANDVRLNWGRIPAAAQYKVYRSNDPNFVPGGGNFLVAATDTFYLDPGVLSGPEVKYYYIVTATDGAGLLLTPITAPARPARVALQPSPLEAVPDGSTTPVPSVQPLDPNQKPSPEPKRRSDIR